MRSGSVPSRLGRALVPGLPFLWLAVFFLLPFLIVLKISLSDPATAHIPAVALSARVLDRAELSHTRECSFAEVWSKPMLPSVLLREITRYTELAEQVA